MDFVKYSVIIPAYNEEDNLRPLIEDLMNVLGSDGFEIIIVNDNSKDKTGKIIDEISSKDKKVRVIHRAKGENGMGFALMDGTRSAKGEYVVWVMADRSDKLESIRDIVGKLDEGYDMVVASRYMSGGSRGELDVDKAIYGSTYTRLASILFGLPIHDITNAYRGFRAKILGNITLESGDFAISPEFAIKAQIAGYRLAEVPTTYFNRRAGQTKFKIFRMGLKYLSLFALRLTYKGRKPSI